MRGPYKQNQYGGTFGGPVLLPKLYDGRNKTFFFAAESYRMRKRYGTLRSRAAPN